MPYHRIAQSLLEINCHEPSFHVDFIDPRTSELIAAELEKLGAEVKKKPHSSALLVICPKDDKSSLKKPKHRPPKSGQA